MVGDQRLSEALTLHQSGLLDEADRAYRSIKPDHPDYAHALHYMGVIAFQKGDCQTAAQHISHAVVRLEEQAAHVPPEFHVNLGNALKRCGDPAGAEASYRRALSLRHDFALGWFNLALLQRAQCNYPGAIESLERAVDCPFPPSVVWVELGECLARVGRDADALRSFERAASRPDPGMAIRIARSMLELGRPEAAGRLLEPLAKRSDDPELLNLMGCAQSSAGLLDRAKRSLARALDLSPEDVLIKDNFASVLKDSGENTAALEIYRQLTKCATLPQTVWSNYLFSLLYSDQVPPERVLEEHQRAAASFAPIGKQPAGRSARVFAKRQINIGYLSGDYRNHPVAIFMEGVLQNHDPGAVRVHLYNNSPVRDTWTDRLRTLAPKWRDVREMSDTALANSIRDDSIDVLVDLSGHTAENRLAALAERPALVQASYLGYAFSTGMPWIDWRLVDSVTDPPGTESYACEQLWRIPGGYYGYTPPTEAPPVSELPALRAGHLTFGVSSNLAKVSPTTLDHWAAILQRFPGSRLLWKARAFADAKVRQMMTSALHQRGVHPKRIRLEGWAAQNDRWCFFSRIDVALDTYPYNQATSTCEALWMGVPTMSFYGAGHPSRMGASILNSAGLGEWAIDANDIAKSDHGAISRIAMMCEAGELSRIRSSMRERLRKSDLLDCRRVAYGLESAYQKMLEGL